MEESLQKRQNRQNNIELGTTETIIDENREEITAKSIVSNYFQSTTIHGLSSIYSGRNIYMKIFWLLVFLSVFGLLVWQIQQIFKEYARNAVVTTQGTMKLQSMVFPAVTLCSTLTFNKSFKSFVANEYMTSINKRFNFNASALQSYGISIKEFLVDERSCSFANHKCKFREDFQISSSWLLGNCFTFKLNVFRRQKSLGPDHGLQVIINLNQDSYKQFIYYGNDEIYSPVGVKVTIHDSKENIEYFADSHTTLISPGTLTSIRIKKQKVVRLPSPYPDKCAGEEDAEKIIGIPLRKGLKYSSELCKFICKMRVKMKYCKAVTLDEGRKLAQVLRNGALNYKVPRTFEELGCAFEYDFKFNVTSNCECPHACNEQRYKLSTSTGSWPANSQLSSLCSSLLQVSKQNCSREFIKDNFLRLQIYFEDFTVETIEQIPAYGESKVISDLGGIIGLWIGASIYSFFELGSTCISLVSLYILRKKKARQQKQRQVVSFDNDAVYVRTEEGRL
eukprot:Seg10204.1 transcript_id=Seg10204.1/GoldUCD/mRNA.D3Y31 product="Acid-sensing ion channel 1" protein_id=Seg10204.1/GoldUCD/D3Y31